MTETATPDYFPKATGISEDDAKAAMDSPLLKLEAHEQFVGLGTNLRRPFKDWGVDVFVTDDPADLTEAFRAAIPATIPSDKGPVTVSIQEVGHLQALKTPAP